MYNTKLKRIAKLFCKVAKQYNLKYIDIVIIDDNYCHITFKDESGKYKNVRVKGDNNE